MTARVLLTLSLAALPLQAQTKPSVAPEPQLSPKAAYDEAMHPLEVTRHSIANWSDIEISALRVTVDRAAKACAARDPKAFTGDTLIDVARLCALGQAWPKVIEATSKYIAADIPGKPLLNQAYAAQIDAQLHLKDEHSALTGSLAVLKAVPYDSLVAEVVDEAIEYMQFAHTADALTLSTAREPLLLTQLRASAPATPAPSTPGALPTQTPHELYAEGLSFAALQQLDNHPEAAAVTVTELDAALPKALSPDDTLPITASRKRYAFLGKPLPAIKMTSSLSMPSTVLPQLPAPHAVTAVVLFPDWCAQCVLMAKQLPESVVSIEDHEAYFYGLMAQTLPPPAAGDTTPTPAKILAETPTVLVPPTVLDQFSATDFPFLILTDSHGIIRVIQPVSPDALQLGGTVDTAIARISRNWPMKAVKSEQ